MPEDFVEFPSRAVVIDLIGHCLDLPLGSDLPVILLLGTRGSGKTELLNELSRRYASIRSCAMQNLGAYEGRAYQVAVQLASGLHEHAGPFRRLQFPRLMLGLVVSRSRVNHDNPDIARRDLTNLLDDRRKLKDKVRATGETLLADLGAPGQRWSLGLRSTVPRRSHGQSGCCAALASPGTGRRWVGRFKTRGTP